MSFNIDWSRLDHKLALSLQSFLNSHLESLALPSFIGKIQVKHLDFGSVPATLKVVDLADPLPEFYLPDPPEDDDCLEDPFPDSVSEAWDRENLPTISTDEIWHQRSQSNMSPLYPRLNTFEFTSPALQSPETTNPLLSTEVSDDDVMLEMEVKYSGDMRLTITTFLIINQPTPEFMILPLTLSLTSFAFSGHALIAYLSRPRRVNFCFLEKVGESLLRDICIESEVGDRGRQVLKNVGRIEAFVVQGLRRLVDEELTFPSYHCIELDDDGV